ncbi:MAG TPA: ATP-binding protein [Gammaproteobacteria bacterium]|nr:ATP-binding protein [Gammaproteobacteria bacterium]
MRLVQLKVKNFRCYHEQISVCFDNLTALVGRNDAGKSALLEALGIFFEEVEMDQGDLCVSARDEFVSITCVFDDLPARIVLDSRQDTNWAAEYLLNDQGLLEIKKIYNGTAKKPKPKGVYVVAEHPKAEGYGDLLSLKNGELKQRMEELGIGGGGVNKTKNPELRRRIWESAEELDVGPVDIPIDLDEAEDAKKVWAQIKAHLPTFALFKSDRPSTDQDIEAQDPMKAAVKEALQAQQEDLDRITEDVKTQVVEIANATVAKLREMDESLASQLKPIVESKKWESLFNVSLTDDRDVPINKRGSGVRRLILLNFFRARAEAKRDSFDTPGVIYAIEEPETSQHPNNQKMLTEAFRQLSDSPDCQVIVTTHTPMLGGLMPLQALRYIEIGVDHRRTVHSHDQETYTRVTRALGVLPDHGVKVFVAVEGINDTIFLRHVSHMLNGEDPSIPALDKLEDGGELIFIPLGGGNLQHWAYRLEGLNIPEFHLYDRDTDDKTVQQQEAADKVNARPMCKAVLTTKRELENYLHADAIRAARPALELAFKIDDKCDVATVVAKAVHEASNPATPWDEVPDKRRAKKADQVKTWLNDAAAACMTSGQLAERDPGGEVRRWLEAIAEQMNERS